MTYPMTDEVKMVTAPHTFQISTGIDLTDAQSVHVWWRDPNGVMNLVTAETTATPDDGIIEWTDTISFWLVEGYWHAESYVVFGAQEKLIGDPFVVPVIDWLKPA